MLAKVLPLYRDSGTCMNLDLGFNKLFLIQSLFKKAGYLNSHLVDYSYKTHSYFVLFCKVLTDRHDR